MTAMVDALLHSSAQTRRHLQILIAATCLATASMACASQAELHTFHCLNGCPVGAPAIDDLVVREIYTLASNDLTKMADWVAYRVTPASIGPSGERNWSADPWLDAGERLEPKDYDNASRELGVDRGHQGRHSAQINVLKRHSGRCGQQCL